jgi:hypothetical protein
VYDKILTLETKRDRKLTRVLPKLTEDYTVSSKMAAFKKDDQFRLAGLNSHVPSRKIVLSVAAFCIEESVQS